MRLLISVSDVAECLVAVEAGADIIDAKEPGRGALGPVSIHTFREIVHATSQRRPVSAALGGLDDPGILDTAGQFAACGATFVKAAVQASGAPDAIVAALATLVARVRGASPRGSEACQVVAVAYADQLPIQLLHRLVGLAAEAGCTGVLLDTADKDGAGLCRLLSSSELTAWRRRATSAGIASGMAGRLTQDDMNSLAAVAPDIAGVRGAACDGGRTGRVSAERVRALRHQVDGVTR